MERFRVEENEILKFAPCASVSGSSFDEITSQLFECFEKAEELKKAFIKVEAFHRRNSADNEHFQKMLKGRTEMLATLYLIKDEFKNQLEFITK